MANEKKAPKKFSEEEIRKRRKFPTANTVCLVILVALQITALALSISFVPQPQDIINEYKLDVAPRDDGSIDVYYTIVWTALDPEQALTWIDVGLANDTAGYYKSSLSENIANAAVVTRDGGNGVYLRIDLDRPYYAGETLELLFTINYECMLCEDLNSQFYEFIPGWFNATPVEHYEFRWKASDGITELNTDKKDGNWYVWEGEMPCGTYVPMRVFYEPGHFSDAPTVPYTEFNGIGVNNDLMEDKIILIVLASLFSLVMLYFEIVIIDSYVSYGRGRGFISGYGHHMHVYGRTNPDYERSRSRHRAIHGSSGGRSGGGCACACACACAGGGRAGCSQKDTYKPTKDEK